MSTGAVTINQVTKTYGNANASVTALDNVSFAVGAGELFGLIGPDGAGKTTLFHILTTLLLADKGTATVDGYDVVREYQAIRNTVGYMPGRFSLYQDLTVEENLTFFATLFGTTIRQNYDLIRDIYEQIEPFRTRRAGKLSGGMKQKLALCCALIHKPTVLFLDEPTTGVDVVSRREFWQMLQRLKQQGITILVSTPYMDEATLCERIALIQTGRILSIDTPQAIIDTYPGQLFALKADSIPHLLADVRRLDTVRNAYAFGEYLHLVFKQEGPRHADQLRAYLQQNGHVNLELRPVTPTIEDRFIDLMTQPAANP